MPAYGKIALVTSCFHPSDVAFAQGWSRLAPGIDGWRIVLDQPEDTSRVSVIPPGAEQPVFLIGRSGAQTVVRRRVVLQGEETFLPVGQFQNLRRAVLALCPLAEEALQEINEELEAAFPRART